MDGATSGVLKLNNLEVIYDRVILVLRGLSLEVPDGRIVAVLGANGAGKSTTLKSISGILRSERGEVTEGSVEFHGERIDRLDASDVVKRGLFHVMEGRRVFQNLSVEDNLKAGAYTQGGGTFKTDLEMVYTYFPRLRERRTLTAGYLSGGEQQMLAIGRSLMARPKLVLMDEPSLGLSPILVKEIFAIIRRINQENGTTILLVEQNATVALGVADYAYVMEQGRVVLEGPTEKLRDNEEIREFYLGIGEEGSRRSFRDVKHYPRRKRWL